MVSFYDSSRQRIPEPDGRPCWLGVRQAMSRLMLTPLPSKLDDPTTWWGVEVMVIGASGGASYLETQINACPGQGIDLLMQDWADDPEKCLREWFLAEPPCQASRLERLPAQVIGRTELSAEDLDL